MDKVREFLAAQTERWKALSLRARIAVLAGVGVLVAVGVLAYAQSNRVEYAVLFSNLDANDAARVLERLRGMNVPYELDEAGTSIRVPEPQVHETRLTLAGEGLPSSGVGFELFDQQRFGESDFAEQVQFRRALEGELSRTISHIVGVQGARVHIVLPQRSLLVTAEREASASVALRLVPGVRLREEQVRGVVHLVASSVPGLAPERVTIVDGDGQALTDDGDDESQAGADADERRVQLERARERAIQQLLDATLGPGAAVARVTAEMDISQEERVEETYDPERTATRSFELVEERDNEATGAAEGTPGAAANLPGGAPTDSNAATTPLSRRSERRNYEITKSVRRAVSSGGRLGRLTVAVVVDGRWTGTGSSRRFQPRPQDELDRIRSIVASAAGISEARGDQLSVECVAFAGSAEARPAEPTARVGFEAYKSYLPYAAGGLVLLVALIAFLLWRRSRRKAREAQLAAAVQELAAPRSVEGLPPGDDVETEEEIDLSDPLAGYDSLRALSLEVARRDPELAASVVRAWLAEDARQEAKAA